MFYIGWDGQKNRIGAAESMDLINWEKKGLVLDVGDEGDWDFGSVSGPFVFPDKGRYLMFYVGFSMLGYEAGLHSIGVAKGPPKNKVYFSPFVICLEVDLGEMV